MCCSVEPVWLDIDRHYNNRIRALPTVSRRFSGTRIDRGGIGGKSHELTELERQRRPGAGSQCFEVKKQNRVANQVVGNVLVDRIR